MDEMTSVAELILEGTLCEYCGEFIGEPVGYPRKCEGCLWEEEGEEDEL